MPTIGSTVPLEVQVFDGTGALVNASTQVLSINLPDGTTATPSFTNPTTGVYLCNYVATQSGRHAYRWVTTGPATTYTDMFEVDPSFSTAIVSLADVKTQLQIPSTNTSYDVQLKGFIDAATAYVSGEVGPIVPVTYTETFDGGRQCIALNNGPVVSISSVTEMIGQQAFTLTQAELPTNGGSYSFSLDNPTRGMLTRRYNTVAGDFVAGDKNIVVTYVAGLSTVPGDIRQAALVDIQALWQQTQQPTSSTAFGGDVGSTNSEFQWSVSPTNPAGAFPMLFALLAAPNRPPAIA